MGNWWQDRKRNCLEGSCHMMNLEECFGPKEGLKQLKLQNFKSVVSWKTATQQPFEEGGETNPSSWTNYMQMNCQYHHYKTLKPNIIGFHIGILTMMCNCASSVLLSALFIQTFTICPAMRRLVCKFFTPAWYYCRPSAAPAQWVMVTYISSRVAKG